MHIIYLVVQKRDNSVGYTPIKAFNIKHRALEFVELKQDISNKNDLGMEYFIQTIDYQHDVV